MAVPASVILRTYWMESRAMVEPLQDPRFFGHVFLSSGTLTWPNGFDLDTIALHEEMAERGLLRRRAA